MSKLLLTAAAALLLLSGTALAQPPLAIRAHELHIACDHGEKGACVRFGILLGQHPEMLEEWRRVHREWFWWEVH